MKWHKLTGSEVMEIGTPVWKKGMEHPGYITEMGFGYEAMAIGYTHYIPLEEILNLEKE